jgi:hypothetical protein
MVHARGDRCTSDSCDQLSGQCKYTSLPGCCKGDVDCKTADGCKVGKCGTDGKCVYKLKVCNDKNPCTTDSCINGACQFVPKKCDDDNKCTKDTCVNGECKYEATVCDDGNP